MKRLLLIPLLLLANALSGASWYVATTGDDEADGSIGTPFATPEKARNVASAGDTIYLRGGTYYRTNTFELASTNSSLTFRGYPGETATIVGGVGIRGWADAGGGIYVTDVSTQRLGGIAFRQLLVGQTRQWLARYPNWSPTYDDAWAYVDDPTTGDSTHFVYQSGDERSWTNATEGEVFIFPDHNYGNRLSAISDVNTGTRTITIGTSVTYNIVKNCRYYVRGIQQELDSPGEWYRGTNLLWFYPSNALSDDAVVVPAVSNIISLSSGATNVTIRNLTLTCCEGSAVSATNTTNCAILANILRSCGGYYATSSIVLRGGYGNTIAGNDVWYAPKFGISVLEGGVKTNLSPGSNCVVNNWIVNPGVEYKESGGIEVRDGVGNAVLNNTVTNSPRWGINFSRGNNILISRNECGNTGLETDDSGILYTYNPDWLGGRGCVLSHNYLHDAIGYGWNDTSDVKGTNYADEFGIYLDGVSTHGVDIIGNVVTRARLSGIFANGGSYIHASNNIIAFCWHPMGGSMAYAPQVHWRSYNTNDATWKNLTNTFVSNWTTYSAYPEWQALRGFDVSPLNYNWNGWTTTSNRFAVNLVTYSNASSSLFAHYSYNVGWSRHTVDYNSYWRENTAIYPAWTNTDLVAWTTWQGMGCDVNSSTNNPLLDTTNWQLDPASPALALGFQQIDTNWGCYYSPDRATWPLGERGMRYLRAGTIRAGTLRGP